MKLDVLAHERVKAWMEEHPREAWALGTLGEDDALRERVLASVLDGREDEDASYELALVADSLENRDRAFSAGGLVPPPEDGERYPVDVLVSRMQLVRARGKTFYRIYFCSPGGWSGFFDTSNPLDVEKVARSRDERRPVTVVGEVVERPRDMIVVMGGRVRVL